MGRPATKYEVGIEYCNDAELTHLHDDAAPATKEYGHLLAEAITQPYAPPRKHVRQATLTLLDQEMRKIITIKTPVFECEHPEEEGKP